MCTIAANAFYTSWRRYGTTRQLSGAIAICVISALLLLPALVWYHLRFDTVQSGLSLTEVQGALIYIALFGWLLPLGTTSSFYLFTFPRTPTTSMAIPSQKRSTRINAKTALLPPRHQAGVQPPFVFSEETPWGWLEYRSGRFQGQRLELKRTIITIGRGEDNDIWLDDDMASREHAEIAWDKGLVYVTDCNSLNGVLLNGQRIRGSALIEPNELLEIGSHRFIFILSEQKEANLELSDPLAHHQWHSSLEALTGTGKAYSNDIPATRPLSDGDPLHRMTPIEPLLTSAQLLITAGWQETAQLERVHPVVPPVNSGALTIQDGAMSGQMFLVDRPSIRVGRSTECDIVIDDSSISRMHVQFSRQADGNYIQDLGSRNGTKVNDDVLTGPRQLVQGDIVLIGNIHLAYTSVQTAQTAPLPLIITPRPLVRSMSGPVPLRLPSKQKP